MYELQYEDEVNQVRLPRHMLYPGWLAVSLEFYGTIPLYIEETMNGIIPERIPQQLGRDFTYSHQNANWAGICISATRVHT